MNQYCIVFDGIIENVIVADADFATTIGALPSYEGAAIGEAYNPPPPEPEPEPEVEPDVWDELAEAYKQGVQSAYDE